MSTNLQPIGNILVFPSDDPDQPAVSYVVDVPMTTAGTDEGADEGSVSVFVLEPFTWGAVIWAIVAGILGWLGGQAFQALIGKKPIEEVIRLAVEAIQAYTNQRLDQETVDIVSGHVNAGFVHLSDLETMDDQAVIRAKIVAADERALDALKILEKKGAQAFGAYVTAVTLRLLCLAAYLRFANQRGLAKEASAKTVNEALPRATRLLAEIVAAADRKITSVSKVEVESYWTLAAPLAEGHASADGPGDRTGREVRYRYVFKDNGMGVSVGGFDTSDAAGQAGNGDRLARINGYKKYRQDLQANVVLPSQKTFEEWQKIVTYFANPLA